MVLETCREWGWEVAEAFVNKSFERDDEGDSD